MAILVDIPANASQTAQPFLRIDFLTRLRRVRRDRIGERATKEGLEHMQYRLATHAFLRISRSRALDGSFNVMTIGFRLVADSKSAGYFAAYR